MERYVDLDEISDGRRYTAEDMVKIGCGDCAGCSACCVHMEQLILLDPYDVHRMREIPLDTLMQEHVELMVDRGVILPALKMHAETGRCSFLNDEGRCSIHDMRPGICRLFPMGRVYEDGTFHYFLQKDECDYPNKTKVKLKKWLDTPMLPKYEKYILDWHSFLHSLQDRASDMEEGILKKIDMLLLNTFFFQPYEEEFYQEFYRRLDQFGAYEKQILSDI